MISEFRTTAATFYKPSGRAPLLGLLLVGIAGFLAVPILGILYGYLIFYVPLIVLSLLLVAGYIFAVSFVLSKAARLGKVRNTLLVGLAGLGFGFLAEYVGWVAWIAAIGKDPTYLIEFLFPLEVLSIMIEIGREGAWSLSGATPSGALLYLIWLLEAISVIGGITYFTIKLSSAAPFCEESDAWAEKKTVLGAFAPLKDAPQFKASISQGIFSAFDQLQPALAGGAFTVLELFECEVCHNFSVLNVKDVKITVDYRGRRRRTERSILSNLILSPGTLSSLRRLIQQQQAAVSP